MSGFTDVDEAEDPGRLVEYLDDAARSMQDTKARLAELARLDACDHWLDVGCGIGHDVAAHSGGVGIDPSLTLLAEGRSRWPAARLAAADGSRLPFAAQAFDGCRVERVLQHVPDPAGVVAEIHRVLRSGARLAVFEPDWASITFVAGDEAVTAEVARRTADRLQHGRIGRNLGALLHDHGFATIEQEAETVSWRRLEDVRQLFGFDKVLAALLQEPTWNERAEAWLDDLAQCDQRGTFRCFLTRHFTSGVA